MRLELDLAKPIYQQIIDEIKRSVARGEIRPGDKLPSHREMAERARVNPNTVQRAYREMEYEEFAETLRGQGTFIKENPDLIRTVKDQMAQRAVGTFVDEMVSLGFDHETIVDLVDQQYLKLSEKRDTAETKRGESE